MSKVIRDIITPGLSALMQNLHLASIEHRLLKDLSDPLKGPEGDPVRDWLTTAWQ
jgi:hypothetical protein